MKLKCLSAPAGQSETSSGQSTGYYGAIPFTLIIPSTQTIQVGQAGLFQGCEVQQAGLNTQTSATYRTLANTIAAMAGTAISLGANGDGTGDNAEVRDTTIIGFNTGIYSNGNSDIKLTNVMDDSTRCADIQSESLGVAIIDGLYCYPLLTRNVSGAQWPFYLSSIAPDGSGYYRATLCTSAACGGGCTVALGNCPINGDTVWITNPQGAESSNGRWTLTGCTPGTITTYCDLEGPLNSTLTATGTFQLGATQILSVPPTANTASLAQTSGVTSYGPGSVDNLIRLTFGGASPPLPAPGQIVSVTGFTSNDTPEANGVWLVQNVGSYYIDLHNSVMVNPCGGGGRQPMCAATAMVQWGYPSVGQKVCSTSCAGVLSGTTVTRVWPAQNTVFLSLPTTMAATGGVTLTYSDNAFGFGGTISNVFQCTHNAYDICLTVANTQDLVSAHSDIVVINVTGTVASAVNGKWSNVILGDGGASPGTTIDLPCPTAGMTDCFSGSYTSGGPFITGYLQLDSDQRQGDSVYINNSNDVQMVNFQTFQHDCGLHIATGDMRARAVNIKVDQFDALDDILFCGVKFDGTADGSVVMNGEINVGGEDVVSDITTNNTANDPNTVENIRLDTSGQTLAYMAMLEDEGTGGSLALAHNTSDNTGYGLVAGNIAGLALTANLMPDVSVYFQTTSGNAQANTAGILNGFAPGSSTIGGCASTTTLAAPSSLCGFLGVPTATYPAGASGAATPLYAMFDNIYPVTGTDEYVAFADAADGSGKCHWVINNSATNALTLSPAGTDIINGGSSTSIAKNTMGIYCTYASGKWFGGTLK